MLDSKLSKNLTIALLLALLTGCATPTFLPPPEQASQPPIELTQIYVRGIFNWWEAEPAYLLQDNQDGTYSISVDLIADGQPYDFRLADEYWTPYKSCGAEAILEVQEYKTVQLYCAEDSKNLQFIPTVTGVYEISVTQNDSQLSLTISKK